MTDITSHSGGFPTAYTQLGTSKPAPQVNTVRVSIKEHLVIDGQVIIPKGPFISNIRLALDTLLDDPENFLKAETECTK